MLMSRADFITVQISNENTLVQIHKPQFTGDKVVASAHSRFLISKGWKGSRKNVPAAYLTGYMAGKKALASGTSSAILYSGTRKYTQRMAVSTTLIPGRDRVKIIVMYLKKNNDFVASF